MNLWFARYNTCYLNEMAADGGDAGAAEASEGVSQGEAPNEAPAPDASSAVPAESSGSWGDFDLDAFLEYDPMKKVEDKPAEPPAPASAPAQAPAPAPAQAPTTSSATPPDARDLELQVLREQLAQMVQGQQANQGQMPLQAPAQVAADPELEALYQVPQAYQTMQVPPKLMEDILSGDPARSGMGLNQLTQGLAQIIHTQVVQQAKARESLIAQRIEAKATQPLRERDAQEQSRKLHDDFYSKHKELDKPEWKPYIAMKMKQLAQQYGISQPTSVFLDMGAEMLKRELNAPAQAPAPVPAQPASAPVPYMAGAGGGRASSPGVKTPQDDIFDTLMQL